MTGEQPPAYTPAQPLSPSDERLWATLIHIGGIILGFISPLLGYLILRERSAFVAESSRNALNFQITILIALVVAYILMAVTLGLLFFLPLAVGIVNVVLCVIAAVAANRGEMYRYPLTIAFVK